MAKYHLSKDGNPRICKAEGACPLGELPHVELANNEDVQRWAEEKLHEQYGGGFGSLSKKARKHQALEGFDRADGKVNDHGAAINRAFREGESLLSEAVLREHVAYYTAMAERDELSGSIIKLAGPFDSGRRGRQISGGTDWMKHALDAQINAETFARALNVRRELETMGATARAIALEELRSLVNADARASEVNTELDDTPADRHKAAVLTLASELYAADPEAQRQEGEDALAGKSDLYEDLETALWLKYHRLPFKEKKAFFYTAKDSVNIVLSFPDEDSEERARRLHLASIKRGFARPDQTYLQLPLKERRHYNKLIAWADNSIKRG